MIFSKTKKILIPLDFSKASLKALEYATAVSKKNNAEIILLHVTEGLYQSDYFVTPTIPLSYQKDFIDQSNKYLDRLAKKLKEKGLTKITAITEFGNVHQEILNVAKKNKVDLIVMATHGVSGVKEFFIGSNTFKIIRDSKCPVLSVRQKSKTPNFKNILLPFRDSLNSYEKINYATDLASLFSSELSLLGIDAGFTNVNRNQIELEANRIKKIVENYGVTCKTKVVSGAFIGDLVLKHARSAKADLIVSMSDLEKISLAEYFTGLFAQQIVNHSTIPVLSVRGELFKNKGKNIPDFARELKPDPLRAWFD